MYHRLLSKGIPGNRECPSCSTGSPSAPAFARGLPGLSQGVSALRAFARGRFLDATATVIFSKAAMAPQHATQRIESMYFEAIFEPSGTMEYVPEAKDLAGEKIAIQEGWIIQEGPFKGQLCFYIPNSTIGWIPKSDLKELKPVPFVRWKEIHKQSGYGS
jgi:hypothetical protein